MPEHVAAPDPEREQMEKVADLMVKFTDAEWVADCIRLLNLDPEKAPKVFEQFTEFLVTGKMPPLHNGEGA